jgi:hypothetical protein
MALITAETVKRTLHDLYGYDIADQDAQAIANTAGAMLTGASQVLGALDLGGIEPPFGYPVLTAEAARIAKAK